MENYCAYAMFSSRKHVTSSRPNGQISCENVKLHKCRSRYVRKLHAQSQVAERHNNIKIVPAPRSYRAGICFNITQQRQTLCARFLHVRPFLWFDLRTKDRIHGAWPNSRDKIVQFMRCWTKCSNPWCTTSATRVCDGQR